jgi:hypothetical protein
VCLEVAGQLADSRLLHAPVQNLLMERSEPKNLLLVGPRVAPYNWQSASSPAAKKKLTTERTEITGKSTSAGASRDYEVTVRNSSTCSLCLHLFFVTAVGPVVKAFLGCRHGPRCQTQMTPVPGPA